MEYEEETLQEVRAAWIITWEGPGSIDKKLVTIVNQRQSESSVAKLVEQIWASKKLAWFEQVAYARHRKNSPYHAEVPNPRIERHQVVCGHNPWLEANLVYNLKAYIDKQNNHHLEWEYHRLSLEGGKVETTVLYRHLVKEIDGTEHFLDQ